ncbi:MAG TPA: MBL fold metallo-hydrolase [Stackebrandtia sp.]|uniref:MBL fold metallo-hydrolase n=1 Tax=Stackebrandtia sp. TaxID=2023065 RepID=UPI002D2A1B6A|nr:MBL fold metallo-hydrolase [Stackebrandtia sp.]HZE40888.1 MBL fold metallo-hydrolase [Stackebrandtia sp.]
MTSEITVRWLGTNAWEIRGAGKTILVDPWVTRFQTGANIPGAFDPDTPLTIDEKAVDEYVTDADCVLITHGHYDHIADVPYIAKRTGATVIGTETHLNLLRAMGTADKLLAQVGGGELYRFDGYTVEVFRSSHGVSGKHKSLLFAGTHPGEPPRRPTKIKHLLEGGSLSFLVTFGELSMFFVANPGFHEREIAGIRPTVMFMQGANPNYPRYEERLLKATGYPKYVIPTHWDDFELPLSKPAVDIFGAKELKKKVAEVSPSSRFIMLDHLDSHVFGG